MDFNSFFYSNHVCMYVFTKYKFNYNYSGIFTQGRTQFYTLKTFQKLKISKKL